MREEVQAIRVGIVDDHLIETAARDLLGIAQARIDEK